MSRQRSLKRLPTIALGLVALTLASPVRAAGTSFSYKTTYRMVTKDPDGVWTPNELAIGPKGTVTIQEYELRTPQGELLISQIWNEDCSSGTCPTKLVRIDDGRRTVLVNDMMHQVVPPNDPQFEGLAANKAAAAFARNPFTLSEDGLSLVNGDYKFAIGGAKP